MTALLAEAARQSKESTILEDVFRCHTWPHAVEFLIREKVGVICMISKLLYGLAFLGLLGGLIGCVALWPGPGYPILGIPKPWAYVASIITLTSGVVNFALFMAVGKALDHLAAIEMNSFNLLQSGLNSPRETCKVDPEFEPRLK